MNVSTNIEQAIADTIIERPKGFKIGSRQFYLYPVTLGKSYLISRLMETLEINMDIIKSNPYLEALRLANTKKDELTRVLSYHTLKGKGVLDNLRVEKRMKQLSSLDNEELAQLFIISSSDEDINAFLKHFMLDKEKDAQNKVLRCKKKNNNTYSFGGKSIYGTLIDHFCQRYGWTMDYILWGISYANLQMLMADAVNTIHLDDKEAKRCSVSSDRSFISGDDPQNMERIKSMFSD